MYPWDGQTRAQKTKMRINPMIRTSCLFTRRKACCALRNGTFLKKISYLFASRTQKMPYFQSFFTGLFNFEACFRDPATAFTISVPLRAGPSAVDPGLCCRSSFMFCRGPHHSTYSDYRRALCFGRFCISSVVVYGSNDG